MRSASHSIDLPVYAASRPMIAVSVLSQTCSVSLSGSPARMLARKSACSWTYMLGSLPLNCHGFAPVILPRYGDATPSVPWK